MIRNDDELRRTREATAILESILASLKRDKDKIHPDRYAIMIEAPLEQLLELRAEIDAYLEVIQATEFDSSTPQPVHG